MAFEIEVNGEQKVLIDESDLSRCEILEASGNLMSARISNRNFHCRFLPTSDPKTQTVYVNNTKYVITIKDELDQLISQLGFNEITNNLSSDIHSPMPGLVLDILVETGQEVEEGQALLVLEAMKMENIIKAHGSGKIQEISVETGDKVEKSQLLISIEPK